VFNPLDHPGIPIDHHDRHWHEFDVEPLDIRSIEPNTHSRIGMIAAVEANAQRFARQFAHRVQDADARQSVNSLADAIAERRRHLPAVRPPARTVTQYALARLQAAFDIAGWATRNEREPGRSSAFQQQARQQLEHLRYYATLGGRAHLPWADQLASEIDGLWLSAPEAPARSLAKPQPVPQPLSLLHDWMVSATDRIETRTDNARGPTKTCSKL
jgi:hypothetical protein